MEKEIEESNPFSTRWKWYSIVMRLSNDDVTKHNEIYDMTFIAALNALSYWKELEKYKNKDRK